MFHLVICVIEIIILLAIARILYTATKGMMTDYVSNPAIAAAIGNAANRRVENSQCSIGGGCFTGKKPEKFINY